MNEQIDGQIVRQQVINQLKSFLDRNKSRFSNRHTLYRTVLYRTLHISTNICLKNIQKTYSTTVNTSTPTSFRSEVLYCTVLYVFCNKSTVEQNRLEQIVWSVALATTLGFGGWNLLLQVNIPSFRSIVLWILFQSIYYISA